jgi:hypothetical protein
MLEIGTADLAADNVDRKLFLLFFFEKLIMSAM